MKKVSFLIILALGLLGLSSCNKKNEAQNPDIKLSEEHGKMLNLIFNVNAAYADWCIDFDTSSENYYIVADYSDIENQKLSEINIYQLQYCNGVITDMARYRYFARDGLTSKTDWMKIRWDESTVTVTSRLQKYTYSLEDPNALILSPGLNELYGLELGYGIKKNEDGAYHYMSSKPFVDTEAFPEGEGEKVLFLEEDGDACLAFISLKDNYSIKDEIAGLADKFGLPYKFYSNGNLSFDLTASCAYKFDGDEEERKTGTYSWFDVNANFEKFARNKIDSIEFESSKIFRKYDGNGHLIYEKRIPDKSLYEDSVSGTVRMITKTIPSIKEFDKSLRQQIQIKGARFGTN